MAALHHESFGHVPTGLVLARVELLIAPGVLRGAVADALVECGWACESIDARDLEHIERENWNLVVIGAQRMSAETLTLAARASRNPRTRVLVVTQSRDPQEIADVLRAGADDHLIYPFEAEELCARARSLIAFSFSLPARRRYGSVGFDFASRTVFDGQARVTLSPSEWDVLIALLNADGEPVPASIIARSVTSDTAHVVAVASSISRLRRKLRASGVTGFDIDTIGGRGYALHFKRTDSA